MWWIMMFTTCFEIYWGQRASSKKLGGCTPPPIFRDSGATTASVFLHSLQLVAPCWKKEFWSILLSKFKHPHGTSLDMFVQKPPHFVAVFLIWEFVLIISEILFSLARSSQSCSGTSATTWKELYDVLRVLSAAEEKYLRIVRYKTLTARRYDNTQPGKTSYDSTSCCTLQAQS